MMNVLIGDTVRVKRGAEARSGVTGKGVELFAQGNRETGVVRQVWRGDRLALVELDRDGARAAFRLRDLRAPA